MAVFTSAALGAGLISLGSGFLATVSAIALNAAVGIGLNLAVAALSQQDAPQPLGVRGKLQAGGDVPRSFVIGQRATAGSLAYANTWGRAGKTPNAYFTQVIALSDLRAPGLAAMWVNGEAVTINTADTTLANERGYPVTEYRKNGKDFLWVKFYDGTQTTADQFVVDQVSSSARPYENTRVGRGIAYAIVTARSNPEMFSGFPSYRFELRGMPLYDPSKDSSVGGNGSQRWSNPATWGGDGDNLPAVQIYNLMRGIRYGNDWLYGLQNVTAARMPIAEWLPQIAKCRLRVQGAGGMEPQYVTGGEIVVNTEIYATIEGLLQGCHGRAIETGGIYKISIGEPAAPVFSITDADILSTDEQSFKPIQTLSASVNGITASYPEPVEAWNPKVAPALYSPVDEVRDGNRRLVSDLDLSAVSNSRQVQQIMRSALAEARRERRHTFALPPKFWRFCEPDAVFEWTSVRNGYVAKRFRIDGVGDQPNLDVMVDVTEVDPSDYNFNFFTDYRPPVFVPVNPDRPAPQLVDGWGAFPAIIYDSAGVARRPSIRVEAADDLDDVRNVRVQVRKAGATTLDFDSDALSYDAPFEWILNGTFLPAQAYQVRGKLVPISARETQWSGWIAVTTPDVKLPVTDIYLPGVVDELSGVLDDSIAWVTTGTREILDGIRQVLDTVQYTAFTGFTDKQELRSELVSTTQAVSARFLDEITVATAANAALASKITTLEVTLPGLATVTALGVVRTQVVSQGGVLNAYGDRISSIEITLPGLATVSAVNSLAAQVVSQGNSITALATRTSSLETALPGLATTSALDLVVTQVTAQGGSISALGGRVSSIEATIPGLATASALDVVRTQVTSHGSTLTAYGGRLSSIEATLPGLASASAVTALTSRVSTAEGTITSQGNAITAVNSTVGNVSAAGYFRVGTETTPSGSQSRIGLQASATTGEAYSARSAALFLEAVAGGTSRVVIQADQFAVLSGSTRRYPFIISGGVVYANEMRIGFAKIDDVQITGDLVVDGTLTAANLGFDQITGSTERTRSRSGSTSAVDWTTIGTSWTINNENPSVVFTGFSGSLQGVRISSGASLISCGVRLQNLTDGVTVFSRTLSLPSSNLNQTTAFSSLFEFESKPSTRGNKTYAWQYFADSGITTVNITASSTQLWWKR